MIGWKELAIPFPVSLVTSVDKNGNVNASPKTWWSPVSYEPMALMIALRRGSDTFHNVASTGWFVLHLPTQDDPKKVLHTAKPLPPGVNELDDVGLPWNWQEHDDKKFAVLSYYPWLICKVLMAASVGEHSQFMAQVMESSGTPVLTTLLHRGQNKFVWMGHDYEVERY